MTTLHNDARLVNAGAYEDSPIPNALDLGHIGFALDMLARKPPGWFGYRFNNDEMIELHVALDIAERQGAAIRDAVKLLDACDTCVPGERRRALREVRGVLLGGRR